MERKFPQSPHNPSFTVLQRVLRQWVPPPPVQIPMTSLQALVLLSETLPSSEYTMPGTLPSFLPPTSPPYVLSSTILALAVLGRKETTRLVLNTAGRQGSPYPTPALASLLQCLFKIFRAFTQTQWSKVAK